jgi:hypothetical protein
MNLPGASRRHILVTLADGVSTAGPNCSLERVDILPSWPVLRIFYKSNGGWSLLSYLRIIANTTIPGKNNGMIRFFTNYYDVSRHCRHRLLDVLPCEPLARLRSMSLSHFCIQIKSQVICALASSSWTCCRSFSSFIHPLLRRVTPTLILSIPIIEAHGRILERIKLTSQPLAPSQPPYPSQLSLCQTPTHRYFPLSALYF